MRHDTNQYIKYVEPNLPENYSWRLFAPSDVEHWGRIETSVLEFDSQNRAINYFEKTFMPHVDELQKRCLFALNPDGLPIATANAWFTENESGRQALMHWVAVCPEYQGRRLGRFVAVKALELFQSLEPNLPVWLHTQTWSHVAVRLYHSLGFKMVRNDREASQTHINEYSEMHKNDYHEALHVLKTILGDEYVDELAKTSVAYRV